MKSYSFIQSITLAVAITANAYAQQPPVNPCQAPEASQFDFWVGEWDLTWPAEQMGGQKGETGTGTNVITKILDSCIVKEEFSFPSGNFLGNSMSVYSPSKALWQQTWVDNQGAYLLFTGEFRDSQMVLRTTPFKRGEKTVINRMVFRNITAQSLDWDWQTSDDGGDSWKDLWNIHYEKKRLSQSN